MKIIKLQAENIKKLKAVEIIPNSDVVILSGKNGQGKTSVLDSIWFALGGGDATKNTPKPIREGEDTAFVSLDLGDIIVSRNWTGNDKTYLKVENKDGAVFKSPQKMLDDMVGRLSFDPLEFSQMSDKEQRDVLLSFIDTSVNLDELEAKKQVIYQERTITNREIKSMEGQLEGLDAPPDDLPKTEISTTSIMSEYRDAQNTINQNNETRQEHKNLQQQYANKERDIEKVKEQIETLQKLLSSEQSDLDKIKKTGEKLLSKMQGLVDPDISVFNEKIKDAEAVNISIRDAHKYRQIKAQVEKLQTQSTSYTEQIKALDKTRNEIIEKAVFPITGLGFDEIGVIYEGVPFKQCSSAEQLRVSMAMAMSLNPKIKVIRITDGSLLDSQNMKIIEELAHKNDYQIWVERVDESGTMGIYIEDGEVK
jgi:DNA repair exonuclease SbcCD ATPase subunit